MPSKYPWPHKHSYQVIHTVLEDNTFTASRCERCNEHVLVSMFKSFFKV